MGSPRSRPAANWVRWLSNGWPDRWPLTQLARRLCRLGIHGRVDPLQALGHLLAVFPSAEVQGMAHQMHDAGLHSGLRESRVDGVREALEAVNDSDEDVFDAAIA